MLFPFVDPADGVSEPPGDFKSNYRHLKKLINQALKEGTPLEELHLIPKDSTHHRTKRLDRDDLLRLLHVIRRIKTRYQRLLQPPVPRLLERDILEKAPSDRLPWEQEALDKLDEWRKDVEAVRVEVRKELNDYLNEDFFRGL